MISVLLLGVLLILLLPGAQSLAVAQPQDNESDIRVMSANLNLQAGLPMALPRSLQAHEFSELLPCWKRTTPSSWERRK